MNEDYIAHIERLAREVLGMNTFEIGDDVYNSKENEQKDLWIFLEKFKAMSKQDRFDYLGCETFEELFERGINSDIFVKMMKKYEEKFEFSPGNEVVVLEEYPVKKYVCVSISPFSKICGFDKKGIWCCHYPKELKKTGKHYDIQSILNGLQGVE